MNFKATVKKYILTYKVPAVTSRAVMTEKETFILTVSDPDDPSRKGVGECGLFRGLSCDDIPEYEEMLNKVCKALRRGAQLPDLSRFPSILMGLETAMADFDNGGNFIPFPSEFTRGETSLITNGLVWISNPDQMVKSAMLKIKQGFRCLKFKIGSNNFKDELEVIARIRDVYSPDELTIRLDANGAFSGSTEALDKLCKLSRYGIHSLEQPVAKGRKRVMARVCALSPIPIALDEELIGVNPDNDAAKLLADLHPAYVILKPTLCGGFRGARQWIDAAADKGIGWWATSALESNIGLNAIAQWTATLGVGDQPQGLGTGQLYRSNFRTRLRLKGEQLIFRAK